MILPYKVADSFHIHGWQVPFARYVELLYGAKSWSLDFDVTQEFATDGSGNRQRLYGTISLTSQYFQPGFLAGYPFVTQMTAGTRRNAQMPYGAVYASEFPDNKSYVAHMLWTAADYPDTIYHYNFQSFTPEGVYDDETFERHFASGLSLPCLAHPLLWKPDSTADTQYACGFDRYGQNDMRVYIEGGTNDYNGIIGISTLFGSTDHFDTDDFGYGEAYAESTALDLSIDGYPVTASNSPIDHPFTTGYAHLTISEWW